MRVHAGQSPVSTEGHRGGNLGTYADTKRARVDSSVCPAQIVTMPIPEIGLAAVFLTMP